MCDQGKRSDVMLKKLGSIPQDLHDLIANLVNPNDEDFGECITLCQWVMYSLEPLEPVQLYLAIQQVHAPLEIDEAHFVDQNTAVSYILHCSRGLVEFPSKRNDRLGGVRLEVQFIHETVRDYLKAGNVLPRQTLNAQNSLSLMETEAGDAAIAETCLQYLLHACKTSLPDETVHNTEPRHRLFYYTSKNWWKHLRRSHRACTECVSQLALTILTLEDTHLRSQFYRSGIFIDSEAQSPLCYASYIGVPKLVSTVLSRAADVNAQGGDYGNALVAASLQGYLEVVQLLLECGAEVNAQEGHHGVALGGAPRMGHLEVVQLLLERGVDVNAQEGRWGSALMAAADGGSTEVVRTLLRFGADPNLPGRKPRSAWLSDVKMAEILDAGADIDFREEGSGDPQSALSTALDRYNDDIVHLMLDIGARIDYSPLGDLYRAVNSHRVETAQLILERGAGTIPQETYNQALSTAIIGCKGQESSKLIRMLLKAGADANTVGSDGICMLELACTSSSGVEGLRQLIHVLLDAGADPSLVDNEETRLKIRNWASQRAGHKQQALPADAFVPQADLYDPLCDAELDTDIYHYYGSWSDRSNESTELKSYVEDVEEEQTRTSEDAG